MSMWMEKDQGVIYLVLYALPTTYDGPFQPLNGLGTVQ